MDLSFNDTMAEKTALSIQSHICLRWIKGVCYDCETSRSFNVKRPWQNAPPIKQELNYSLRS